MELYEKLKVVLDNEDRKNPLTDEEIAETILFDLAFDFQMDYGIDISVVVKNKD